MEREQTFEEFKREIRGTRKGKLGKVRGSMGVYDFYKKIRKNHWFDIGRKVTEKEFYSIIRGVNKYLAENISNGETVTFPEHMGKIQYVVNRVTKKRVFTNDNVKSVEAYMRKNPKTSIPQLLEGELSYN